MKKHDVIVVGAGPVGSYTAYLLARKGLDVGILEKNQTIGKDVNCTGVVSAKCFKRFVLPDKTILRPIDSIKAFSPSGNYVRYRAASPLAYVVNRSLFEQEINALAVREGATVYLNARVERFNVADGRFEVKVRTEEEQREIGSAMGVVATGFDLNPPKGVSTGPKDYLYGIQTEAKVKDIGNEIEIYFGREIVPGSFAWIVPTNNGLSKIGLIAKKNPAALLNGFLRNPLIGDRINSDDNQIKCSPIPYGSTPKSHAERLIIVGEAAGQVKTTTGGGIYFGFLCSEIAASVITKAFRKKDFSEKALQEYDVNWRKAIDPELKAGKFLRNFFSRLSDTQINLFIDLARTDGILPMIKENNFDWQRDLIMSLFRKVFAKKIFRTRKSNLTQIIHHS